MNRCSFHGRRKRQPGRTGVQVCRLSDQQGSQFASKHHINLWHPIHSTGRLVSCNQKRYDWRNEKISSARDTFSSNKTLARADTSFILFWRFTRPSIHVHAVFVLQFWEKALFALIMAHPFCRISLFKTNQYRIITSNLSLKLKALDANSYSSFINFHSSLLSKLQSWDTSQSFCVSFFFWFGKAPIIQSSGKR